MQYYTYIVYLTDTKKTPIIHESPVLAYVYSEVFIFSAAALLFPAVTDYC